MFKRKKMHYPKFYDSVKPIVFKDELAQLLGAVEDGVIEFTYLDVVKAAGHSCPTVAGAYLLVQKAVDELYIGDRLPVRGEIEIHCKDDITEGVTGVMANIFSQLTGATSVSGFKGLTKRYNRTNLIKYNQKFDADFQFIRTDSKRAVKLNYDPSIVPTDAKVIELMIDIEKNSATEFQQKEFQKLWQARVEKIFASAEEVIEVID